MATAAENALSMVAMALQPKRVTTGAGTVENPQVDPIEAIKFAAGQAAASKPKLGIRFRRFKPPGAVLVPKRDE